MREKLDLNNPISFNQKMQWLKINNNDPMFTQYVDKYGVREIVKSKIGDKYLIPLLGVWDSFNEIDFDQLPNQFVLKATHDSGSITICRDKSKFDIDAARVKLSNALKKNQYYKGRERVYKNVKPRIIAEKLLIEKGSKDINDYKFFCFNGIPKILFIASDRSTNVRFDFYDMELNRLPFRTGNHGSSEQSYEKIKNFDEMKSIASVLSQSFPFIRIDLYNVNGQIYFGEFTFYHDGGIVPFYPKEWDIKLGHLIDLPSK